VSNKALVLGGGGPVGIAWEAGVLAGLAAEGVWPAWDLIVGTSAGSFVGAAMAQGQDPESYAQAQIAAGRLEQAGDGPPAMNLDPSRFVAIYMKMPVDAEAPMELLKEFGALSKSGAVVPEELYMAVFESVAEPDASWPTNFAAAAVEVDSGAFTLIRQAHGAPLRQGVAASCAVPGVFPPVRIGDGVFMDGGCRSPTSADAAAGHARVVTLAVNTPLSGPAIWAMAKREAEAVEKAGGRHALIVPDAEVLQTFPMNFMDGRNRAAITEAGIAQGRREAARLRGFLG